jgi:hypothetical protein
MILMDFWGDNPFAELGLPYPPAPSKMAIHKKIREKTGIANRELRKLSGHTSREALGKKERLEKEIKDLTDRKKEFIKKANDLADVVPFDTLLAVQPIAPVVFAEQSARASVIALAWRVLWEDETLLLSDTQRRDFRKDFTPNLLVDSEE